MTALPILIVAAAVIFFSMLIAVVSRYKKCPPDNVMVVYGVTGGKKEGGKSASKCIHGGAAFVWPVFQAYQMLDLTPIQIKIDLKDALSKQNIRVDVPATFTVSVSTEPNIMEVAAVRLLGLESESVRNTATEIIYGQFRQVVAQMSIEDINADRDKFMEEVSKNVEGELEKVGLSLINVNIEDIKDESGYIEALGQKAASEAIEQAKVDVAEKRKDGAIGEAAAKRDQRIKVAEAEAKAVSGEKDAEKDQRIQVAQATATAVAGEKDAEKDQRVAVADRDAEAVEQENLAAAKIAQSQANLRTNEAEAARQAIAAEKVSAARAQEEGYAAEAKAEAARADMERKRQKAAVIVPAEIEKEKQILEAEAEAEEIRRKAQGEADGQFAKLEAKARGNKAMLEAVANGLEAIVRSANGNPSEAAMLMMVDKAVDLTRINVDALKNIKVDKLTVWDSGKGDGAGASLADYVRDLFTTVPGLQDVFSNIGMELPEFLGKNTLPPRNDDDIVDIEEAAIAEADASASKGDPEDIES